MPVNEERVQLLADALRSGEFPQGHNMLRTHDDKYCCLGVACEVARLNGIGIKWDALTGGCACEDCNESRWNFDGTAEALGRNVADWYGFDIDKHFSADVEIGTDEDLGTITMINANDDLKWTFDQIADALEAKYLNKTGAPE